jgi:sialic acid synthase SpsE
MQDCYIVAEIGSNCFKYRKEERNLKLALDQIDAAKICGADAVKFQMFTHKELFGVEKYSEYELPKEWLPRLKAHCDKRKIDFLCSGFSLQGFRHLNIFVDIHKIASPEACSETLLNSVLCMANPVIVSNGCLTYAEQVDLVRSELWGADDVLLECVSRYPAKYDDYDLYPITSLASKYRCLWGVSDHTLNPGIAFKARQLGATYFEKHVDLVSVSAQKTPDSCVSADMFDFKKYCNLLKSYRPTLDYHESKLAAKKKYGRRGNGYRPIYA